MAVVPGRSGWSYGVKGASAKKANKPGRWATMPELLRLAAERFQRVQVTDWDVCELIDRLDVQGALIFVDPPYLGDSRPGSLGSYVGLYPRLVRPLSGDPGNAQRQIHELRRDALPASDVRRRVAGCGRHESHRNIPNGEGRDVRVERLYVLDRSGALGRPCGSIMRR
jgi:hypothetical protein